MDRKRFPPPCGEGEGRRAMPDLCARGRGGTRRGPVAGSGHGISGFAAEMRPEFIAGMGLGKGRIWHGHAEELAQGGPAIGRGKDQQPARWDGGADACVVGAVGGDAGLAVQPAKGILHHHLVHRREDRSNRWRQGHVPAQGKEFTDGLGIAGPPVVFGSFGVDYFCLRKGNGQFVPYGGTGEIDLGRIAGKNLGPVYLVACGQRITMQRTAALKG